MSDDLKKMIDQYEASLKRNGARPPANMFPVDVDEDTPAITLGGVLWPIPVLAWRQNKVIEPLVRKLLPQFNRLRKAVAETPKDDTGRDDFLVRLAEVDFSAQQIEDLATIVYTALTRAKPGLARGEFDGMPMGLNDLMAALPVVLAQTRGFREAQPGDPLWGRAATSQSTGSSPSSITAPAPEHPEQTS